jgi:protein-arginine kinase
MNNPWLFTSAFEIKDPNLRVDDFFDQQFNPKKTCPTCKSTFAKIKQNGGIGCSDCYTVFRDDLLPIIETIHGTKQIPTSENPIQNPANFEPHSQTVVSSRVRLARNLRGVPFATRKPHAFDDVISTLEKNNFNVIKIDDERANVFGNKGLSEKLLQNKQNGFYATREKTFCPKREYSMQNVMLGEEDNIRISHIMNNNFDLQTAYKNAKDVESIIAKDHEFAYDKNFGYLTSCPTNLGTGMRASVMMYLPALSLTEQMKKITSELRDYHINVRGGNGENSNKSENYLYQISNQSMLGKTEQQILNIMSRISKTLSDLEISAKSKLKNLNTAFEKPHRHWFEI